MTHYVIRGGLEGKKRLEVLSRTMWPTTSRLLERAGLHSGKACLDLGCGGGDVTLEIARWIGSDGRVVGLDMDKIKLDLARGDARERGLSNVSFQEADIGNWNEVAAYDLIFCRFLLTHLSDPASVLRRMWTALRPGGTVAVEDVDFSGNFCHPPCTAFDSYGTLYRAAVARRGGDADIGPRLYSLARAAGWRGVKFEIVQPAFVAGEGKQMALLTLINIADAVLEEGLATEAELEGIIDELDRFTEADDTIVSVPRIFQLWACRE